ncbi:MAG: molybdopterin-binding oxidoreductase, partial [Ilumatobacteraceae bacterium]
MEPPQKHQRVGRIAAAITGMIVAVVGLGVAELAAGLKRNWRSPVLDVGDRVIDHVPRWAKEFAIARFGSNDKTALLIGIGLMLAVYAAIVGIIAFRHRLVAGMVGIAAFGLLGAWAAIEARTHPPVNVAI